MAILRATDLSDGDVVEADVCICGTGPAGLSLARALWEAGLDVCLVESGVETADSDLQKLNDIESVGLPMREGLVSRLRRAGGTSNLWAGRCMALQPIDFEARPWVAHSGWPIAYEEYARYLADAAATLRLPAEEVSGAVPPEARDGEAAPCAATLGESAMLWGRSPARFWRLCRQQVRRSSRCKLLLGFTATNLTFSADGHHVEGVAARAHDGKAVTVRARRYALATGGIENARLLLLAKQRHTQAAISDAVGRYYMDHPRAVHGAIQVKPGADIGRYLGRLVAGGTVQRSLALSPDRQRRDGLLNVGAYLHPTRMNVTEMGYAATAQIYSKVVHGGRAGEGAQAASRELIYYLTPREMLPFPVYRAAAWLKRQVKPRVRDVVVVNLAEQVPDPDSRVTLGEGRDRFDNPVARLDWRMDPREVESLKVLHRALDGELRGRNLGRLVSDPEALGEAEFVDSSHHMGTTRMSADSRTGVVDANLKLHGVDNLYVCGSSVFPTGGNANPTWSIVALTLRLARHLLATPAT